MVDNDRAVDISNWWQSLSWENRNSLYERYNKAYGGRHMRFVEKSKVIEFKKELRRQWRVEEGCLDWGVIEEILEILK